MAQRIKCLAAVQETQVRSLSWEDPLEKEMATQSSILAWRIPWTEEPERAIVHGIAKSRTRLNDITSLHFTIYCNHLFSHFCLMQYTADTRGECRECLSLSCTLTA